MKPKVRSSQYIASRMSPQLVNYEIVNSNIAQNLSQTVDKYLESIGLSSTFIAEIVAPQRQARVSGLPKIRPSLDWVFDSPEFGTWVSEWSSSFLWCSGIPKSGKTVLSCYLENYLRNGPSYKSRRDIIAIFFGSVKEDMGSIETERILSCIASQLLYRDSQRLKHAYQQYPRERWLPKHPPLPFKEDFLGSLWGLIQVR